MFKQLLLITHLISSMALNSIDEHQFNNTTLESHTSISDVSLMNTSWDTTNEPTLVARNTNTNINEIQVDVQISNTRTSYIEYDLMFRGFYWDNASSSTDVQNVFVSVSLVTDKYEDSLSFTSIRADGTIDGSKTGITLTDSEQIYEYNIYGRFLERTNATSNKLNFISHDVYGSTDLEFVAMKFSFQFNRSSATNTKIRITHFIDTYDANDVLIPSYNVGFQKGYTDGYEEGRVDEHDKIFSDLPTYGLYTESQYTSFGEQKFQEGYTDGYEEGEYVAEDTKAQIYDNALQEGYDLGFEEGKVAKNPFGGFFEVLESATSSMHNFFSIEILPNLTLSTILGIFIALPLFIFFMKLISAK